MGPWRRGAKGTPLLGTEGSWNLLVPLLLFWIMWKIHAQADGEKSIYLWQTGTWSSNLISGKHNNSVMHTPGCWFQEVPGHETHIPGLSS